jgi:hypothetical protein
MGGDAGVMGGGAEAVIGAGVETTGRLSGRTGGCVVEKVFAELSLCGETSGELGGRGMS